MNELTVTWEADDGCYIVRQDGTFIGDFQDLHSALVYALAVSDNSGEPVVVTGVEPL